MKTTLKRAFCLLLSLTFALSFAACKKSGNGESSMSTNNSDTGIVSNGSDSGTQSTIAPPSNTAPPPQNSSTGTDPSQSEKRTSLTIDQVVAKMPANLRGSTLKFLYWEDITTMAYKEAVASFEAKTGIKFKTEIVNKSEYDMQLATRITSGNSPDMFKVLYNNPGSCKNLQPITASGYNFNDTAWDEEIMRDFTFNGKVYAVNAKNSPNCNVSVMIYNKKALRRAGMSDQDPYQLWKSNPGSWTWSKLWSMCDAFLKANNNADGYFGISIWEQYASSFGGGFSRYDALQKKSVNLVNSAATVKGYETIMDAISKKWATHVADSTAFTSGKVLFSSSYSSILEKGNGYEMLATQGNLGAVPFPTDSQYQPILEYCAYGIPVGAKNAKAVPYFLRIALSPEGNNLDNFYINPEARAVSEFAASKSNKFFVNGWDYDINQKLLSGTSSQVKSVLDSYVGTIQKDVDEDNAIIANLPK